MNGLAIDRGRDAVRKAKAAGLPSSTALMVGSMAVAHAEGKDATAWRAERVAGMVAMGMRTADARGVVDAEQIRIIRAGLAPWSA